MNSEQLAAFSRRSLVALLMLVAQFLIGMAVKVFMVIPETPSRLQPA